MTSYRIAVAHIGQETCSFTPIRTTVDTFRRFGLYEGGEMLTRLIGVGSIGGFLAAAEEEKMDLVPLPLIHGRAGANGMLTDDTLNFFEEKIITGLKKVLPVDGFFFSQHGAAAAENEPDVEGRLLSLARRILGPNIPVVSPLDHHANISQRMIDLADALLGHQTQPHLPFETGKLAAHLLFSIVRGDVKPVMAWRKIPMLAHQEQFLTSREPMKVWFDSAREYETDPKVLSVSPFPMQPWLDVPEGGWSTVVVTDDDQSLAKELASEHARMVWKMRERFMKYESIPPNVAVQRALAAPKGLIILSDTGDSVFAGAPGDSTHILRELLRQKTDQTTLVPIVDEEAVILAIKAGVGNKITLPLGGKRATQFHQPVEVTGTVSAIGDGRIHGHTHGGTESFDMGRTVLLESDAIKIVVSEQEGLGGNHPVVYRFFGLEPKDAKMAVLKTASNFQYYADMTSEVIRVDTPGPSMSHLEQFKWQHIPRPIWPLDDIEDWQ